MKWEKIGEASVDSGQILITDPCYIKKDFENEFNDSKKDDKLNYNGCCHVTLGKNKGGEVRHGIAGTSVCVSSGFGDGCYEVFVKRKNGRIAEARIVFLR